MFYKLLLLALSLEGAATLLATKNESGVMAMLAIYSIHAVGSVVVAILAWTLLPSGMKKPRLIMLSYLFTLNFFVPMLPLLIAMAQWLGAKFRQLFENPPIVAIDEPEYSIYRVRTGMQARGGRTRTKLMNLQVPVTERLTALLAIQETPARVSADLLRQLLADPIEDLRLLAYGMLDSKEKAISTRVLEEESALEEDRLSDDERYGCNKRLAELYWELVYQRLVQGDMMRHACEQSRKHAKAALESQKDAGLWFLLARVGTELREPDAVREAVEQASRMGFPSDQLAPYYAELAFLERRFDEIEPLFNKLDSRPSALRLAAIHDFWTKTGHEIK